MHIGILLLEYYFLTSLTPGGSDWAKRKAGDEAAGPTGGCYVIVQISVYHIA